MSYSTVDEVCSEFPRFQRNQAGSVSDAQVADWLEQFAARIDSALAERGIIVANLTLTAAQAAWLANLNQNAGCAKLGLVLQGTVTLQPGEYSLAASRMRDFEKVLRQVSEGVYDKFWGIQTTSKLGGVAGAEVAKEDTPEALGDNRAFGKNQEF